MSHSTPLRRFRILVTISVLFIALVVAFGLFFRQFVYWQTSKLLTEESNRLFAQINHDLSNSYLTTRKTISQAIHILAATDLPKASTREQRFAFLPLIRAALLAEPAIAGLQVGYASGEYFIVRPISDETTRHRFSAPPGARLVVDNIARAGEGKPRLERFWLDDGLNELQPPLRETVDYDPRIRPWYVAALQREDVVVTPPYLFHFIGQMGVTAALMTGSGEAVIAADVSLYNLSQTLSAYDLPPGSELIVLEKTDDQYLVMAYRDPKRLLITEGGTARRTAARDLESPVIRHAAGLPNILGTLSEFTFDQQQWLASTRKLALPENDNLFLVMLSPKKALLAEAYGLQEQTLRYTALMILLSVPLTYLLARKISRPIQMLARETERVSRLEFSGQPISPSTIKEVDELGRAVTVMETTISKFIELIRSLAGEQDLDRLLDLITQETMTAAEAHGAVTYIINETSNSLEPKSIRTRAQLLSDSELLAHLCHYQLGSEAPLVRLLAKGRGTILDQNEMAALHGCLQALQLDQPQVFAQPLLNRQGDSIGLLCLIYHGQERIEHDRQQGRIAFIEALSGFAAVTLESRRMLKMQKDLLDSFIRLLAGAIDSKSPYTGGHCQRVPVLTELLAAKACAAAEGPFADFNLTGNDWEAIRIASWLHDCGKVTTPEYVVDKATKLETIYDRIHEVRMRFEVIKRELQVACWQDIAEGGDRETQLLALERQWADLDEEFRFVAECNLGGEYLDPDKVLRLRQIGQRRWMRTLDDRLGISWEELQRKERTEAPTLPAVEPLLADREDHIFIRTAKDGLSADNPYGFRLEVPEHLYNKGELYNLSISRGTLTEEERYKINDHIVQSIIMLKQLPYPKHLAEVPDIAGGHHEKIDGSGYPRRLTGEQMSIPARIMVIADIFEALTASDRPYKKAKPISEAIRILHRMAEENHIDRDLFQLFLSSGAYLEYGRRYLLPEQLDQVDIAQYLGN